MRTTPYLRGGALLAAQYAARRRRLDEELSLEFDTGNAAADATITWFLIGMMIFLSAVFSGLTLGLLGLDKTGLEIVMGGGSAEDKAYARRIYPVREDGNRLLCTLLLGNVAVNALLSITLANIASSLVGFFASTALIVIFGEILPQALCSRYALRIGSALLPLVQVFLVILAPAAIPLGKVLDYFLDDDVGTVHTKREMMHYMKLHVKRGELDRESGAVMRGALEMKEKRVAEVMTPLEDVYMLPESTRLSFRVVREIFEQGFSRVPVFRGERQRIVGLLFVKDLIFVDPEDETALTSLLGIFARGLQVVEETDSLDDVLRIFKAGHGHLALVRRGDESTLLEQQLAQRARAGTGASHEDPLDDEGLELLDLGNGKPPTPKSVARTPSPRGGAPPAADLLGGPAPTTPEPGLGQTPVSRSLSTMGEPGSPGGGADVFVGIVTLEDIVEEIIGDEIIDETDVFVDVDNHIKVAGRSDFDFTKLRRLDAEFVDERLSPEEVQAVTAHFLTNVSQLAGSPRAGGRRQLTRDEMSALVRRSRVVEHARATKNPHSDSIKPADRVYVRGEAAAFATLVLNGKLSVLAGVDGFRAEAGPWTVLGADALVSDEGSFVPDFSAHVATESVRCIYVTRAEYARAVSGVARQGDRGSDAEDPSDAEGLRRRGRHPPGSRRALRRGEMAEKRRRLALMAGGDRGRQTRAGREALDSFQAQRGAADASGDEARARAASAPGPAPLLMAASADEASASEAERVPPLRGSGSGLSLDQLDGGGSRPSPTLRSLGMPPYPGARRNDESDSGEPDSARLDAFSLGASDDPGEGEESDD